MPCNPDLYNWTEESGWVFFCLFFCSSNKSQRDFNFTLKTLIDVRFRATGQIKVNSADGAVHLLILSAVMAAAQLCLVVTFTFIVKLLVNGVKARCQI